MNSKEQLCQDLERTRKGEGEKVPAGRRRASNLRQEQAWLTQETARRGGKDEAGGLLPEKLLPGTTAQKPR